MAGSELDPQEREYVVRVRYWACNVIGHRHRSPISAAACTEKRKGQPGELKKLKRNLSMLSAVVAGTSLSTISRTHHCSESNIIKAINSSLKKANRFAQDNGGCPYPERTWKRQDFTNSAFQQEIKFYRGVLEQMESILTSLVK